MNNTQNWYIVKEHEGHCNIIESVTMPSDPYWGPFSSQGEAIARRVGLIRAGKCQPF